MDRLSAERLEETTRLGSYEIIRRLARGGMAELFLARGPEGLVVVKKILPKHATNPRLMQLFLDEARLAGSLDHPNIVRTYGAGRDRGIAFFAMEHLHGQDVRTLLHRAWTFGEQMPVEHAVHIASHVAAALHYAHERRGPDGGLLEIVHRDVSPSNIFVSYGGAVKLVDFGVAKAATSTVKTRSGALKGKISYMSPEQAKGSAIDRRSDIFSLGIVLWEMITTQRLFRGQNDLQTLQLIINEPPRPPSELQPACPAELDRIVLRALAQEPAARYPTAAELLRDLEELARAEALAAEPEALAGYVAHLFSPEVQSWQSAQAAGRTLAEHLTSGGELTIPLTESDFIEALDLNAMVEEDEDEEEDSEVDRTEIQTGQESAVVASGSIGPPSGPVKLPPGTRLPTPVPVPPGARLPTPVPVPPPPGGASAPVSPARGARTSTPPIPMPIVPAPPAPAAPGAELAAPASGPWSIARGSAAATPGAGLPAVPAPPAGGGLAAVPMRPASSGPGLDPGLDPELADRLLRRGLWVTAAIVAFVIVFSIVMALVS